MTKHKASHHDRAIPGIRVYSAQGAVREMALSLLLTGSVQPVNLQAVARFEQFIESQQMDASQLFLAEIDENPVCSVLILPNPGRTGMVFMSPLLDRGHVAAAAKLVAEACMAQDDERVKLFQALLDPGQQLERQAFLEAGYEELAELVYMRKQVIEEQQGSELDVGEQFTVTHWSQEVKPMFAEAILASYVDTMDCPGLVGMREIDDIIEGHQAAGEFEARNWLALFCSDEPVAVMLLNPSKDRSAMELVYLGVSPQWRGRGVGRMLMDHALGVTAQRGLRELLLAVDDANEPALGLYKTLGFKPTGRKYAMIFALLKNP